jgi:hypothetical protein
MSSNLVSIGLKGCLLCNGLANITCDACKCRSYCTETCREKDRSRHTTECAEFQAGKPCDQPCDLLKKLGKNRPVVFKELVDKLVTFTSMPRFVFISPEGIISYTNDISHLAEGDSEWLFDRLTKLSENGLFTVVVASDENEDIVMERYTFNQQTIKMNFNKQ